MVHTTRRLVADWGMVAGGATPDATRQSTPVEPGAHESMWPSIARARRRIGLPPEPPQPAGSLPPKALDDAVIVLTRPDFDRLRTALAMSLGDPDERPDTPARMAAALSAVLADFGTTARPTVLRCPATLSVPEAWEIHLTSIDPPTREWIREAARTGRFEA
jgi:hypothetical protein